MPAIVPGCDPDAPEAERKRVLLDVFREFVLDLHSGAREGTVLGSCSS